MLWLSQTFSTKSMISRFSVLASFPTLQLLDYKHFILSSILVTHYLFTVRHVNVFHWLCVTQKKLLFNQMCLISRIQIWTTQHFRSDRLELFLFFRADWVHNVVFSLNEIVYIEFICTDGKRVPCKSQKSFIIIMHGHEVHFPTYSQTKYS